MKPKVKVSAQLFCFHHAGGSSNYFTKWKRFLHASIEVIPIGLPGRQERFQEPLITDFSAAMEGMTGIVVPRVRESFALVGHSMGALLAFELARTLEQLGRPPCALFVSSCRAPGRSGENGSRKSQMTDSALIQEIRAMNGTPESLLLNSELMKLILPIIKADFAVCDSYKFHPQPFSSFPIFAFGGLDDPDVNQEDIAAWGHLTSGGFQFRMFEGDHFFIHKECQLRQICSTIMNKFQS